MRAKFTPSFKIQAVEKALSRAEDVSLSDIADALGVGYSTLSKWIAQSRNQALEPICGDDTMSHNTMTNEKRPQDWSLEDKLNLIMMCASLDKEQINAQCREHGVYPHHLQQWQHDFISGNMTNNKTTKPSELKSLKKENKDLKRALRRKEKALAEAAALLILQKKVNTMWGSQDEDDSQ